MLDLWITTQPDDGLCKKPKDVAEVLINILILFDLLLWHDACINAQRDE